MPSHPIKAFARVDAIKSRICQKMNAITPSRDFKAQISHVRNCRRLRGKSAHKPVCKRHLIVTSFAYDYASEGCPCVGILTTQSLLMMKNCFSIHTDQSICLFHRSSIFQNQIWVWHMLSMILIDFMIAIAQKTGYCGGKTKKNQWKCGGSLLQEDFKLLN